MIQRHPLKQQSPTFTAWPSGEGKENRPATWASQAVHVHTGLLFAQVELHVPAMHWPAARATWGPRLKKEDNSLKQLFKM